MFETEIGAFGILLHILCTELHMKFILKYIYTHANTLKIPKVDLKMRGSNLATVEQFVSTARHSPTNGNVIIMDLIVNLSSIGKSLAIRIESYKPSAWHIICFKFKFMLCCAVPIVSSNLILITNACLVIY